MAQAPPTQISRPDVSAPNPPEFDSIAKKASETFGYLSFTVLQWFDERHALKRIYSTDPTDYPVGGEKIMTKGAPWPTTVIQNHQPYASWNIHELQETYVDAPALVKLGVHQTLCVPIFDSDGNTIAAFNFSAGENHYNQGSLKQMQELAKNEGTQAFMKFLFSQN